MSLPTPEEIEKLKAEIKKYDAEEDPFGFELMKIGYKIVGWTTIEEYPMEDLDIKITDWGTGDPK